MVRTPPPQGLSYWPKARFVLREGKTKLPITGKELDQDNPLMDASWSCHRRLAHQPKLSLGDLFLTDSFLPQDDRLATNP